MRHLSLNLLTVSLTVVLLALLTLPAIAVRRHEEGPPSLPTPNRAFGVYVDPWHIDDWTAKVGATPTIAAKFEAFWRRQTITKFTDEVERRGIRRILVSWEPWKPVPTKLGVLRQARPQPGYTNQDIANGVQDPYIRRFARNLSSFDGTVYLRYAHEMNGFWYPWSHDPVGYRRAWRHIVRVFRDAGAWNVRFVWSINPNLYDPSIDHWVEGLQRYWPGSSYVDVLGSTMINFGGRKTYGVEPFERRLRALHRSYGKNVVLTEVNTQWGGRVHWLVALRGMLARMRWIEAVVWSQLPSRAEAQFNGPGDLHWDVQRDPATAVVLRGIIEDGFARTLAAPAAPAPVPGTVLEPDLGRALTPAHDPALATARRIGDP